jgi:hypothetical protein
VSFLSFSPNISFVVAALAWCFSFAKDTPMASLNGPLVTMNEKYIEFPVMYHPSRFNRAMGLKNHHFIFWEKGSAAGKALFTTPVLDSAVHDALVRLGAIPGNNLTNDTWARRGDEHSPFPDMRVEGSQVAIEFILDSGSLQVEDVLVDKNGKKFDFRFGGNRALIPVWKSGCVACLQSCPGSKIGNHTYSIRDLVNGNSVFSVRRIRALTDGKMLKVRIHKLPEPK